jgi:hypothetical protein
MEQKNKKLCLIIPCILDEESADENIRSIRQNLLKANPDFAFDLIIHIDDHLRPCSTGTLDSIEALYRTLEDTPNCSLKALKASPKKGLVEADGILLEEFLKTDAEISLRIDDDVTINHPVYLGEFFDLIDDTKVIRLSYGWDPKFSSEDPFIINSIFAELDTVIAYENDRYFCSEHGNFFTRKMAEELLRIYNRKNPPKGSHDILEDQAAKCAWYRSLPIYTLAWKTKECKVNPPKQLPNSEDYARWRLPVENHFLLDKVRRNKPCGEIGYYN